MLPKQLEKLAWYISASAAIVVLIACIVIGAPLYIMAAWVSLSIALFYVLGDLMRFFLVTKVFPPPLEEDYMYEEEEFEELEELEESDAEEEIAEHDEESSEELPLEDIDIDIDDTEETESDMENEPVENAFLD